MTLLSFSATNILPFPSFIQQPYSSTKIINTNILNTNIIKTQILRNKNTHFFPVCLATPKQQKTGTPVKKNIKNNNNINTNSSSTSKRVPKNNNNSTSSNNKNSSKNNNINSSSSDSKNNNNNNISRSNKNSNIISVMSNGEIFDEENNGSKMMTKRVAKNNNSNKNSSKNNNNNNNNNDEENDYVLEKSLSSKKLANNKNSNKNSNIISNGEENNGSNMRSKNSSNKISGSKNKDDEENERYRTPPIPNPPAGFVVDGQGNVLILSNKRIATIVDPSNNFPLECIIRRVFTSSRGDDCMLLCPVDMPVQILKSTNVEGWSAVSDDEVEAILPNAAYALAKIHIHLVHSGFCYTARGGFCYTEDDIFEFRTDDGQDVDGLPTEGIEITCFHLDGSHYMVYTPSDPLLFVVVKDQNGQLQILDDDLLEDPAVISAIDEETEFNALVEEEAALLDSLLGKR